MKSPPVTASNESLASDFRDFILALNTHAVECVLVGGYALAVHGVIRATADIDFLYRRTKANVRLLCDALNDFGAPANVVDIATLMLPDTVTMFGAPPHRIDLLSDISGVSFEQVWAGSRLIVIAEVPLRVIGLNELRANKLATGRKRDAADLRLLDKAKKRSRDE